MRSIKQLWSTGELWIRVIQLWVRLQWNRWAQREQHPLHTDGPELAVTISQIEWELRDLGFEFLV